MGYTTEFEGRINVDPPLSPQEIKYLNKFSETRRMNCKQGPYYVGRSGFMGQDDTDRGIINFNTPPEGQPSLWCQWIPTEDGSAIEWNGAEKFYNGAEWMAYLIEHFIGQNPKAKGLKRDGKVPCLCKHTLNGTITAQGEDANDAWLLHVRQNRITVEKLELKPSGVEKFIGGDNDDDNSLD